MINFSIIVCTHNGSTRLYNTLKHLNILETGNEIDYEVIVVSNASNDNTEIIFRDFVANSERHNKFNFYSQYKKGKDFALRLGIEKAKNEWIVICDDDNWLMANYLLVANYLIVNYRDASIFGSKSIPVFDDYTQVPNWFKINSLKYACGEQYSSSGYISYRQDLWGAGCIFNKKVLYDALTVSNLILSKMRGEDTELFYRIMMLGFKAFYSNELIIRHFITNERLKIDYFNKMLKQDENSKIIHLKYNQFIKYYCLNRHKKLSIIKWNIIGFLKLLRIPLVKNKEKITLMLNIFTSFSKDSDFEEIKHYFNYFKNRN